MLKLDNSNFKFSPQDEQLIAEQRAITKKVNKDFIQVGAIFLKSSSKNPIDTDWALRAFQDVNLQDWIDDPAYKFHNVGFNLQFGWMDVDIDSTGVDGKPDPEYNRAILSAMSFLGVDARFRFGRHSVGFPTHCLVQLGEEESNNFELLSKFEPKEWKYKGARHHVQLRSYPTNLEAKNVEKKAKQTVMPGSVYTSKTDPDAYDLSVWYDINGDVATTPSKVASTTPRRVSYTEVVRAIAFGTVAYVLRNHWVEGSRQVTATKVSGWLARVVKDSQALNNHEGVASEVWCPIDTDDIAERLLHFICEYVGDDEAHMRVRTFRDATEKLARNPDAKIPGWPAMELMLGGELLSAMRAVLSPGSDVSVLTKLAERYVYDETDNHYIDRTRHKKSAIFVHEGAELERRHKGDFVRINNKPKAAFNIFEGSDMRKRVDHRDMFPDLEPGAIYKFDPMGQLIPDDSDTEGAAVFNTWRGWDIQRPDVVDPAMLEKVQEYLNKLLGYLTRDNPDQIDWAHQWVAWTIQNPGKKQQIGWVCVGGQGVGKSFWGNNVLKALFGKLWGAASSKVVDTNFAIEAFIDKMMVFIDEAKFSGDGSVEEIKKLLRNVEVPGAEKFGRNQTYNIYARVYFASNRFDINVGQANVIDRALFYTRAYDKDHLGITESEFKEWAEALKPWFEEFNQLLSDRSFREHMMEFYSTYPCTKAQVESIKHSSGSEADIVASNMSWTRRIAASIIESGWIFEGTGIEAPFTLDQLSARVETALKTNGIRFGNARSVLNEYEATGMVEKFSGGGRRGYRFKYKTGTLTKKFGEAIGMELDPDFEYGPGDFGDNDATWESRCPFKGQRKGVVNQAAKI